MLAFTALNTNGQAFFVTFEPAARVTQRLELVLWIYDLKIVGST